MGRQVQAKNPRQGDRPRRDRLQPQEAGLGAGLPASALLWAAWIGEENPNYGSPQANVRPWSRKGEDGEQGMED